MNDSHKKVILLFETSRGYDRQVLRGISQYSRIHGPWQFFWNPKITPTTLKRLKNWGAQGLIVMFSKPQKPPITVDQIIQLNLPTFSPVNTEKQIPKLIKPSADYIKIGSMGAEHLLQRGFRNLAFCLSPDTPWLKGRGRAFCQRVTKDRAQVYWYDLPKYKKQCQWENEQFILAQWLKSLPKPIGIMACSDERSRQILEACKIVDLEIPSQVAIIGVDNDQLICELAHCPLSSIALNAENLGFQIAEILDKMMNGEKVEDKTVPVTATNVVTRKSTDIIAIQDHEIAQAIQYIRHNSKKMIQVSDVVDSTTLSRRVFYERFKKIVGHSPYQEIINVKVDEIIKLLLETNMSVSQITLALGYSSDAHISRIFRRKMKTSLIEYRKRNAKH